MDQFYFEEGYIEEGYFGVIREAAVNLNSAFTPSFTVNVADTTGYYIPDYIEEGYFVSGELLEATADLSAEATVTIDFTRIVSADSLLASEFTKTASVGKIVNADSAMSAAFTQTATLSAFDGSDIFAFAEAQLAIEVNLIRDNNVAVASVFDIATDGRLFRDITADADSAFIKAVTPERSRDYAIDAEAAFSFDVEKDRIRFADSQQTATASVFAVISNIRGVDIVKQNFATLNCQAEKTASGAADLTSEFNSTSKLSGPVDFAANLTATSFINKAIISKSGERPFQFVDRTPATGTRVSFNSEMIQFGSHALRLFSSANDAGNVNVRYRANNNYNFRATNAIVPPLVLDMWFSATLFSTTPTAGKWLVHQTDSTGQLFWGLRVQLLGDNSHRLLYDRRSSRGFIETHIVMNNVPSGFGYRHLRMVRKSSELAIYVNGIRQLYGNLTTQSFGTSNRLGFIVFGDLNPGLQVGITNIDEFCMRNDPSADPTATSIVVPTTAFKDTPNTLVLLHFDNNFNDDYKPFFTTGASLQSQAQISAILSGPVSGSADLASQALLTAQVSVDRGADLTAFAEAALDIDALRIRPLAADLDVVTDKYADVEVTRDFEITAASEFDVSIFGGAQRNATADFASVASKLAIVVKVGNVVVDINSEANVDVDAVVTASADADLLAETQQDTQADRTRSTEVELESTAVQTTDAGIVFDQSADIASEFAADVNSNFIASASADLFSEFTDVIDASGGVVRAEAFIVAEFNQTTDVEIFRDNSITAASQSDLSADAVKSTDISVDLDSNTDLDIGYLRFRDNEIVTESVAVKVIVAVKNVDKDIDLFATTDIDVDAVKTTDIVEDFASVVDIAALATITAAAAVDANTVTELAAQGTTNITGEIHAVSEFSLTCDAEVTFVIEIQAFANASVDLTATVFRDTAADFESSTDIAVDAQRIRHVDSQLSAVTGLEAAAEKLVDSGTIEFQSIASKLSLGRLVNLDMKVYTIPPETRLHRIDIETRGHRIGEETRIFAIRSTR